MTTKAVIKRGLLKAIKVVGNNNRLAIALKVTPQTVGDWVRNGLPPGRADEVSEATDYQVGVDQLRIERRVALKK